MWLIQSWTLLAHKLLMQSLDKMCWTHLFLEIIYSPTTPSTNNVKHILPTTPSNKGQEQLPTLKLNALIPKTYTQRCGPNKYTRHTKITRIISQAISNTSYT